MNNKQLLPDAVRRLKSCYQVQELDRTFLKLSCEILNLTKAVLIILHRSGSSEIVHSSQEDSSGEEKSLIPQIKAFQDSNSFFKNPETSELKVKLSTIGLNFFSPIIKDDNTQIFISGKSEISIRQGGCGEDSYRILGEFYISRRSSLQLEDKVSHLQNISDLKQQQIKTIFELSNELNLLLDRRKILSVMIHTLMGQFLFSRCILFLREMRRWKGAAQRGISDDRAQYIKAVFQSSGIASVLKFTKTPFRLEGEKYSDFIHEGFSVAVPMLSGKQIKGVIFLGERANYEPLLKEHLEMIQIIANLAAEALDRCKMVNDIVIQKETVRDLRLARTIQRRLLPDKLPDIPGYDFFGINSTSKDVGGDYYDMILLQDGRVAFTIADVSGKGVSASLLMSNLQACLHTLLLNRITACGDIVSWINRLIHRNTESDRFISFFLGILDPVSGEIEYTNAGHNYPLVVHAEGTVSELESNGIILGILPEFEYPTCKINLRSGELVLLYTDGITEAINEKGEEYGEERLIRLIKKNARKPGAMILKSIQRSVKNFAGQSGLQDDTTLLILSRSD